jgi:Sulfotransferase family
MPARPPILITGAHRSGTTWIGRTLCADRGIGYIDEPFNVQHPRYGACAARFPHQFMRLDGRSGDAYRAQVAHALQFRFDYADAASGCRRSPDRAPRAALDALRCARARLRHQRPLVKDPIALCSAEWLANTFGMQVVVMIRHPAAFAASLARLDWRFDFSEFAAQPALMTGDLAPIADQIERFAHTPPAILDHAALLWKALHLVVLRYRSQYPDWIMLRHEDISREPAQHFSQLSNTLGVGDTKAVLERARRTSQSDNPAEAPPGVAHVLHRDSRSAASAWKGLLTPDQVASIRLVVDDVSSQFYADDDWG